MCAVGRVYGPAEYPTTVRTNRRFVSSSLEHHWRAHKERTARAKYAIVSYILHMWIPRAVEPRLQRSAKTRPVIVLTGARQTGKTSTFLRLFPKYAFVSLDLPTEAEQAEKEPERFSPASSAARHH